MLAEKCPTNFLELSEKFIAAKAGFLNEAVEVQEWTKNHSMGMNLRLVLASFFKTSGHNTEALIMMMPKLDDFTVISTFIEGVDEGQEFVQICYRSLANKYVQTDSQKDPISVGRKLWYRAKQKDPQALAEIQLHKEATRIMCELIRFNVAATHE